ncbi:MAG: hypothetical protein IJW06_07350 [Clostridia bacterium]|nr:hypothetical protein [Clostridia bacterium]
MSKVVIDVKFDKDDFIFIPAACYDGNRFRCLDRPYPPMFKPEEARLDMETCITDVPRLEKDGSGKIELTSADPAVPCIGVYKRCENKGYLLFTVQEIGGKSIGIAYEDGKMILTYPANREYLYQLFRMNKNEKPYVELDDEIPYKLIEFDCRSIEEFYQKFFDNRKIMGMDDTLPVVLSKEEQWKLHSEKFNSCCWQENGEYYAPYGNGKSFGNWEPGWVGGAMQTYAFLKLGTPLEKKRAMKTIRHLFKYQGKSGLFYGVVSEKLEISNDGFGTPGTEDWVLTRKSADCLYYVLRQFELMEKVPEEFEVGIRRTADCFINLWKKYGQIGQFAGADNEVIYVGGSASAAIVSAGLVLAYRYFKDEKYLDAAKELGEYYYQNFAAKGYTTGGPGEILSAPDSESAFGLLESYIWLYDETKDEKWLSYAKHTANICSSWVVAYNFKFPKTSEFGRLGMKSIGSVIANIQNKHSAPGICTLSGTSVRKLSEWTGDERYMTLYREITETVSQYMATDERPIWNMEGDKKLRSGFICERVNMSDWETDKWIGSVWAGSCWCESSNMVWLADM